MKFQEFKTYYGPKIASGCYYSQISFSRREDFPGPALTAVNAFVENLGFRSIMERWYDLQEQNPHWSTHSTDDHRSHLATIVQNTLAYGVPWFNRREAWQLAEAYYDLFQPGRVRCLSNRVGDTWIPLTDFTFDAAYVALNREHIGIILIADED